MSKAFTKESDDQPEVTSARRPGGGLPPGATNYLTASGARGFREELDRLLAEPGSEGAPERIRFLRELLRTAVVVKPSSGSTDRVRFGARVVVRSADRSTATYRIVGVDEADPGRGDISCISPLARALTHHRSGDHVRVETPDGIEELEILSVARD